MSRDPLLDAGPATPDSVTLAAPTHVPNEGFVAVTAGGPPDDVIVTAAPVVITQATPDQPMPTLTPSAYDPAAADSSRPFDSQSSEGQGYDIRVECPGCGTIWEGNDIRPHAEWFCGTCDYPLFWALPGGGHNALEGDGALSRLPGTDGRSTLASLACPACGERNPPVPTANCLRCGAPLTPAAPALAPPTELVAAAVPTVPVKQRRIWPWVLATGALALALVVVAVLSIRH
jgi:hypothetical protein